MSDDNGNIVDLENFRRKLLEASDGDVERSFASVSKELFELQSGALAQLHEQKLSLAVELVKKSLLVKYLKHQAAIQSNLLTMASESDRLIFKVMNDLIISVSRDDGQGDHFATIHKGFEELLEGISSLHHRLMEQIETKD